jgi:RHS repeat-associated protein
MKCDRDRVPASRRSARAGFVPRHAVAPTGRRLMKPALLLFVSLLLAVVLAPGCSRQTGGGNAERTGTTSQALAAPLTVVHNFGGTGDGIGPAGVLQMDSSGNIYGTTGGGGAHAFGTVFKMTPAGAESVLYSFCPVSGCADGQDPVAGVVFDGSGNMYGTTQYGGANGNGVLFKLTSTGTESVLHSFGGANDATNPNSGLLMDGSGNLYGVTANGGAHGEGAIFKVTSAGVESVLYSFCPTGTCPDGQNPGGPLAMDNAGNIYGTVSGGGAHGDGAVFKVTSTGVESVVYSFCPGGGSCSDGEFPGAGVIIDSSNNLYGTTLGGGANGFGTVFEIPSGGAESVLYSFCHGTGCADGTVPLPLTMDSGGNLYGMTQSGGGVFQVTAGGTETVLYTFCQLSGCADGQDPDGSLLIDNAGNVYGTTQLGGTHGSLGGTLFELTPSLGKQLGSHGPAVAGDSLRDCQHCSNKITNQGQVQSGDPIDVGSGDVFTEHTDYTTAGQNPFAFTRYYNSRGNAAGISTFATELGVNWRSNYDRFIRIPSSSQVIAERADGRQITFALVGSVWTPDSDVDVTLTHSGSTWTLTDSDDTVESYTTATSGTEAVLNSITARNGYAQTLTYTSGQLTSVSDSYSRSLTLAYNTGGTLHTVTTPDSTTITYGYTSVTGGTQLTSCSFSTSPAQTITYNYAASGLPFALTSITDENGNSYATWTYDTLARGLTSQLGSGANLTTVTYGAGGGRTVTNALGVTDTYGFTLLQNMLKVTSIKRASTSTTAAANESFTYDSSGYLASKKDWNTNKTTYTNNAHGLPTTVNEAVGSSVARTTTFAYNATHVHLPDSITTPGVTVSFTYDTSGDVLTATLTDTTTTSTPYSTNGQTRTTTNTYSNHLLATTKTPNGNTTTFGYSTAGALTSITDPLSHVTNITSVTGGGRPLTIVDPNSVSTSFTYDARQRLLSSAVTMSAGVRTTSYQYDAAGNLTQTTLPDSSSLANTYDTAHRLTKVTDALSNTVNYTLDALGDRTAMTIKDGSGGLYAQHSATFDALGRQLTDVGGRSQTTTLTWDKNSNLLTIKDGNSHTTTRTFDALNRVATTTDANSGVVTPTYDAHDRITAIQDALSHSTTFVIDGFGDVIQQASPDTGTTVYHFDSDANLTSKTDALSVLTNQTFDALDRIATRSFPADTTQNVTFSYDSTGWPYGDGIGRLTGVTDASGLYEYFGYDERGEINFKRTTALSTNYDIYPSYDAAGRYNGTAYPSGLWAGVVSRNSAGQPTELAEYPTGSGSPVVVAWMGNEPFGPMNYITYGNGITGPYNRDNDFNISNITLTNGGSTTYQNITYTLDGANNVTGISDSVHAANSQTFTPDVINRVTAATSGTGGYGSLSWVYDKNGNLTSSVAGGVTTTYALTSGSNKLSSITVGTGSPTTVSTNADGNITSIPPPLGGTAATLAYYVSGRLSGISGGSTTSASYTYGFDGQRSIKTIGSTHTIYIRGVNGELLEEITGSSVTDYISQDGRPLGIFIPGGSSGTLYYVHPDALGTPQFVTNSSAATVWSTTYQPYGTTGSISGSITDNIRLPGQYFDSESGLYQNWNRDYMPNLGRYAEADPLGLGGGMNPYAYTAGNPASRADPSGLTTAVVINNNNMVTGTHAGLVLDTSGPKPFIYDPYGTFDPSAHAPVNVSPLVRDQQYPDRDEGGYVEGSDLASYVNYQLTDGPNVQVYLFFTTPAEEAEIEARAKASGAPGTVLVEGGTCAGQVSGALQGIGPFAGLPYSATPAGLGNDVSKLKGAVLLPLH